MTKKNRKVLFLASNNNKWMGGVYYVKNIVNQFLQYINANNLNYKIYILMTHDVDEVFDFCKDDKRVIRIYKKEHFWDNSNGFICRNLRELGMIYTVYSHGIDFIFPSYSPKSIYCKKAVTWIPDFQHVILPEMFSKEQVDFHNEYFEEIAHKHSKLILSSEDAFNTYKDLYPEYTKEVYVVPFASAIEEELKLANHDEIRKKYDIVDRDYFIICNQFYKHKNHITVIKAIKEVKARGYKDICVVCTGFKGDLRDKDYFPSIEKMIREEGLERNIIILGLVPKSDQIALIQESIMMIQPSRFEGWGTCVEDAKTLGKAVLLSDIPIHREQGRTCDVYFGEFDYMSLADLMIDKMVNGIEMVEPANKEYFIEYGKRFDNALD